MHTERDRIMSSALALCYLATAAVIVAVYREPLAALVKDIRGAIPRARRYYSVRDIPGKMGEQIREIMDDA